MSGLFTLMVMVMHSHCQNIPDSVLPQGVYVYQGDYNRIVKISGRYYIRYDDNKMSDGDTLIYSIDDCPCDSIFWKLDGNESFLLLREKKWDEEGYERKEKGACFEIQNADSNSISLRGTARSEYFYYERR